MASQKTYDKADLVSVIVEAGGLSFNGPFTLKSGRKSPYFFTSTALRAPRHVRAISEACAAALQEEPFADSSAGQDLNPTYNVVFGPAYKGIGLCFSVVGLLSDAAETFQQVEFCFNRKEVKTHGEGGGLCGAPLQGKKVVILDDVLTAGTAIKEAISLITAHGGTVAGVLLLFDRQERLSDEDPRSAIKAVADDYGFPIRAVLQFNDVLEAIEAGKVKGAGAEQAAQLKEYRARYGSTA